MPDLNEVEAGNQMDERIFQFQCTDYHRVLLYSVPGSFQKYIGQECFFHQSPHKSDPVLCQSFEAADFDAEV